MDNETREYKRLWASRKRRDLMAKGLCGQCGKNRPGSGHAYCESCREKVTAAARRLKLRRLKTWCCRTCGGPNDRATGVCECCLERERRQYAERRKRHHCTKCGKPARSGVRCERCRVLKNAHIAAYKHRLKLDAFRHYGGPKCACCREAQVECLTIDHVSDCGSAHRREISPRLRHGGGGHTFYGWLKRHNYPPGFQVLCLNCNWMKFKMGKCPHQL